MFKRNKEKILRLWVDDVRPAPEGYILVKSVYEATIVIEEAEFQKFKIEVIDCDHDAGKYADKGGDYIKLLDWLENTGRNYPIRIHSMNPVGVENMRRIIQKNGWTEIR